jgi:hypothetical protein
MKRIELGLMALCAAVLVLAACAGTPGAAGTAGTAGALPADVIEIDDVTVDWKGRNAGVKEPPLWVQLAAINDPDNELSRLPRLEGKKAIPLSQEGANLPVLESWLNTQAYVQCGQRIRTAVATNAQTALKGDLQSAEAVNMADQFSSLYAQATITGLNKEMDSWVKTRSKSKGTERYTYYVIYSISQEDLKASIDETFGKVETKNKTEQELKVKLKDQMDRLMENINF